MIVTMRVDGDSYMTYDLGNGFHAIAKYKDEHYTLDGVCPTEETGVVIPIGGENTACARNRFSVFVAFTTEGWMSIQPQQMSTYAQACVNHLNGTLALSGIGILKWATLANALYVPQLVEKPQFFINEDPSTAGWQDVQLFSQNTHLANIRNNVKADVVAIITKKYKSEIGNGELGGIVREIAASFDNAYCIVTASRAMDATNTFAHEVTHLLGAHHEDDWLPTTPTRAHGIEIKTGSPISKKRRSVCHSGLDKKEQYLSNPAIKIKGKAFGDAVFRHNAAEVDAYLDHVMSFYADYVPFNPQVQITQAAPCLQNGIAKVSIPKECSGPFTYEWSYSDNGINWTVIASSNVDQINTSVPLPSPTAPPMYMNYNTRKYRVKVIGPLGEAYAMGTAVYDCYQKIAVPAFISIKQQEVGVGLSPVPASSSFNVNLDMPSDKYIKITLFDVLGREVDKLFEGTIVRGVSSLNFSCKYPAGQYFVKVSAKDFEKSIKIIFK